MARYAVVVAAVAAFLVTTLSGIVLVPLLRRLKFGQTINEIGPSWHKNKQGIPTMGGFMFILGSLVGVAVGYPLLAKMVAYSDPNGFNLMVLGILTSLAFSMVGFIDDFLKVFRKQNMGLNFWGKISLQTIITVTFLTCLHMMGRLSTIVRLPFFGSVEFGILFYPLSFLLIVGVVNAVNLTDGLDGLASSVTLWVMCAFMVLLNLFEKYQLSVWAAALAGACIGFLLWNFYPAKVFMGDTGSMFLGGSVVAIGFCMGRPDILLMLSFVYLVEAFSVMIQVSYFKLTHGKRLFKMTPIHHHFELMGWGEVKIVALFSFLALAAAIVTYIYAVIYA